MSFEQLVTMTNRDSERDLQFYGDDEPDGCSPTSNFEAKNWPESQGTTGLDSKNVTHNAEQHDDVIDTNDDDDETLDSIKELVDSLLGGTIDAKTPTLTDVHIRANMFIARIPHVSQLRRLAKQTENNLLRFLTTRPVKIQVEFSEQLLTLRLELKVFLEGVESQEQTGSNNVSIYTTLSADSETSHPLVVSAFLYNPNKHLSPYRRSFTTETSTNSHKVEKGLRKFIPKVRSGSQPACFGDFIHYDTVLFGLLINSASFK